MLRRSCSCKPSTSVNPTVRRVIGLVQKHHEQHKKLENDLKSQLTSHLQTLHEDVQTFVKDEVNAFYDLEKHARTKFVVATVPTIAKEEKEEVYVDQEEDYHNSEDFVREDYVSE